MAIYLNDRNRNRIVPMKRLVDSMKTGNGYHFFSNLLDTDLYNF